MRPSNNALGPLEAEVMELVWAASGPITVKQLHTALLKERQIAYTTWYYTPLVQRQALIVARVEQLLASIGVDEAERQYVAAEIRCGRARV
jgi:penicillinase repressor